MVKKCNTNVHHEEYNLKEVVTENNILGSLHRLNILGQMESRKKNILLNPQNLDPLKVPALCLWLDRNLALHAI